MNKVDTLKVELNKSKIAPGGVAQLGDLVGRDPACKHKVPHSSRGEYHVGGGLLACIAPLLLTFLGVRARFVASRS